MVRIFTVKSCLGRTQEVRIAMVKSYLVHYPRGKGYHNDIPPFLFFRGKYFYDEIVQCSSPNGMGYRNEIPLFFFIP